MSEVFEGYERQHCEISASFSRKCAAAAHLDGEQKKQRVYEIKSAIKDSESFIRKMDLEARSLQPSVKAALLAKLKEYKSDLNNQKSQVKKLSSNDPNQASREELLEAGMADTLAAYAFSILSIHRLSLYQFMQRIKDAICSSINKMISCMGWMMP